MHTNTDFGAVHLRLCLRKLRNLFAALVMLAVFLRCIGVPWLESGWHRPRIRLVPFDQSVVDRARNAATTARSWFFQENRR